MEELNIDSPRQVLRKVRVGSGVKIFNFVNAYECEIGDESKIGSFVEIQKGVRIGKRCKVSSHSFICEGVELEDGVFVGHGVTFINDRSPRAINPDGSFKTDKDWTLEFTKVGKGAGIGSGATIMCGITIGEGAIVGAGSMVTKDVKEFTVVAGNPARYVRDVNEGE
jgi:UDP-2-acetamido-3-amino-2,3-dideoxy-glucuronate N-acetyltransferase